MISLLIQDLRFSLRMLARRPVVSTLAVLCLALGIGVNSSMFTVINAVLFRHLPVAEPERLVELYTSTPSLPYAPLAYPDYEDFRDRNEVFSDLLGHAPFVGTVGDGEQLEFVFGEVVTGSYFPGLGIQARAGRSLLPEDDRAPDAHPVAVLGHGFWLRHFGGNPEIIGQIVKLNGRQFTVVGVAPERFKGTTPGLVTDLWVPVMMHDAVWSRPGRLEDRSTQWLFAKGRLAPKVTVEQAEAQLSVVARVLATNYPDSNQQRGVAVLPSSAVAIFPSLDGPLFGLAGLLMILVGLVLLIACANIANLLLSRALERRREIAIRLALGSSRWHLIRQLVLDGIVLAMIGGAGALLLTLLTVGFIRRFRPQLPIPLSLDLTVDPTVLGFTLLVALATGLACSLIPALRASRRDLVPALRDGGEGTLGHHHRKLGLRNLLVVAQVVVSTVLLIGAGLFVRSLQESQAVDPGFALRHAAVATVDLGLARFSEAEGRAFCRDTIRRLEGEPGVRSATLASHLPLGMDLRIEKLYLEGQEVSNPAAVPQVDSRLVGPGYFATFGIDILKGRPLDDTDGESGRSVAVVNSSFARRFFPAGEAIGRRLSIVGPEGPFLEVVGVAADSRYRTLSEAARPFLYLPFFQTYDPKVSFVVAGDPGGDREAAQALRRTLDDGAPNLPILEFRTLAEHLRTSLLPARLGALLLSALGLLGLLLASAGLYGVVAYAAARRTHELGVRMALGAERGDVLRLVVRESLWLVALGAALGLPLALVASHALSGLLYGVSPADPITFLAVPLVLAMVAVLASWLPARRAAGVDPIEALRHD